MHSPIGFPCLLLLFLGSPELTKAETAPGPTRLIESVPLSWNVPNTKLAVFSHDAPDLDRTVAFGRVLERTHLTPVFSSTEMIGATGSWFGVDQGAVKTIAIRRLDDLSTIAELSSSFNYSGSPGSATMGADHCAVIWPTSAWQNQLHLFSLPGGELLKTFSMSSSELELAIHGNKLFVASYLAGSGKRADLIEIDLTTLNKRIITGPTDKSYDIAFIGERFTTYSNGDDFLMRNRIDGSEIGPVPFGQDFKQTTFTESGELLLVWNNTRAQIFSTSHPERGLRELNLDDIVHSEYDSIDRSREGLRILERQPGPPATQIIHHLSAEDLPTLKVANASASEADEKLTFSFTLDRPADDPVEIRYRLIGDDAEEGRDFVGDHGIINFAPGETTKSLDVALVEDLEIEDHESFHVHFESWAGAFYNGPLPGPRGTIVGSGIRFVEDQAIGFRTIDFLSNDDLSFFRDDEGLHAIDLETGQSDLVLTTPSLSTRFFLSEYWLVESAAEGITIYDASTLEPHSTSPLPDGETLQGIASDVLIFEDSSSSLRFQPLNAQRSEFSFSLQIPAPSGWHYIIGVKFEGSLALVSSHGKEDQFRDPTFRQLHLVDLTTGETRWTQTVDSPFLHSGQIGIHQGTPFYLANGGITLMNPADGQIVRHISRSEIGQPVEAVVAQLSDTLYLRASSIVGIKPQSPLEAPTTLDRYYNWLGSAPKQRLVGFNLNGTSYAIYQDFNGIPSAHVENGTFTESDGVAEVAIRLSEASEAATSVRLGIKAPESSGVAAITQEPFPVNSGTTRLSIPIQLIDDFVSERSQQILIELQVDGGPALPDHLLILDNEAIRPHLSLQPASETPVGSGAVFGTSLVASAEDVLIGWTFDGSYSSPESPGMDWPLISSKVFSPSPLWLPRAKTNRNNPKLYGLGVSLTEARALTAMSMEGSRLESGILVHDLSKPNELPRLIRRPFSASEEFGQSLLEIPEFIVVGSPKETGGAVYFLDATTFATKATLQQSGSEFSSFGSTLAFDGTTLWVGSPKRSVVEGFDPRTKDLTATIPSPGASDFGQALAASNGELLVGAKGRAYLFEPNTSGPIASFSPPGSSSGFGYSVALSSSHILIGDPLMARGNHFGDSLEGTSSSSESSESSVVIFPPTSRNGYGSAYLWSRSGGRVTRLLPSEYVQAPAFGTAVALTPTRAMVSNISPSIDTPVLEAFILAKIEPSTDTSVASPDLQKFLSGFSIQPVKNQVGVPSIEITLPDYFDHSQQNSATPWCLQHSPDLRSWRDILIGSGNKRWPIDPLFETLTEDSNITIRPPSLRSGYFRIRAD